MIVLIFDTECTGLPIGKNPSIYEGEKFPYIVQLSWVLYDDVQRAIIEDYDQIIKINEDIILTDEVIAIHGVTRDMIRERGVPIKEALRTFRDALKKSNIIVGHNLSFDKKLIIVEGFRNKVFFRFSKQEYCTMKRSMKISKEVKKNGFLKLAELHNYLFGFIPENLHNSKIDVETCLKCYLRMVETNF